MTVDGNNNKSFFKKIPVTTDFNFNMQRLQLITKSYNKKNMDKLKMNDFSWTPQINYISKRARTLCEKFVVEK